MSCLVKGCRNGYRSSRQENIRLGLKQKSLFKSPKSAERRKEWCQVLGLQEDQLKPKHVICEDHFKPSDIIRYDVTHLPDGTKFLLEREKCRLHPQAVPCNSIPVNNNITKTTRVPDKIDFKKQNKTLDDIPRENSNVIIQSAQVTEPIKVECCPQKSVKIDTEYSFEKLKQDVKESGRSSGWGSVVNGDAVDFLKWDAVNFRMTMVVRVYEDLTMKLFTADKHLIKNLDVMPKSFLEILQKLMVLGKTTLCQGTGLKEIRPAQCLGEVDVSNIEKRRGAWKRCQFCCESRKKGLERQRELKRDVQRRLKLTNRKNNRLKIKIDKLKEEVERSKKKCAGIEEKILYEKIESLPLPIQESVRTCLAAAKVKPKGRRYTMNWIHECLLIRMKSRSIYEHLRTHFILPLPCIDTLDRYIKKWNLPETNDSISETIEEKLATIMSAEENGSLVLDDMTLTERIESDKSQVLEKLEEIKKNTNASDHD